MLERWRTRRAGSYDFFGDGEYVLGFVLHNGGFIEGMGRGGWEVFSFVGRV